MPLPETPDDALRSVATAAAATAAAGADGAAPPELDIDFGRSPHDQFFKSSLRRPEVAADLVAHYLPPEVTAHLELGGLTLEEGSFVDEELREQQSDLLFRSPVAGGGEALVYILFEHKSYVDRRIAFQLLRYQVRIWERDLRRAGRRRAALCPILPIVVYHGRRRWTAPHSLSGLYGGPPALHAFGPDLRYALLDLQSWKKDQIVGGLLLRVTLLLLQAIFRPHLPRNLSAIASSLRQLGDQLLREQELQRLLAYAARAGRGLSATEIAETAKAALPEKGDSMALTLAEKWFAEGRDEGRVEGRVEGRDEGLAEGLAKGLHAAIEDALRDRFGDAGLALLPQIRQMSDLTGLRAVLRRIWQVSKIDELRSAIDG